MAKVGKKYDHSIFIFTRDLRLDDNTTLMTALEESKTVIPIFIFNPAQINDSNKYKSNNCLQFMCECLDSLNEELIKKKSKLIYFYDDPVVVIKNLIENNKNINSVYINIDYTPFAKKREESIREFCEKHKPNPINFTCQEDYLLNNVDVVKNSSSAPYVKYTPFYTASKAIKVRNPVKNEHKNYYSNDSICTGSTGKCKFPNEFKKNIHNFYEKNPNVIVHGGKTQMLKILKNIKQFSKYNAERDYMALDKTTHLSAYLKFNVVSIRELYYFIKKTLPPSSKLIVQLYWRDFYMYILHHNQHVIGNNMKTSLRYIKWENDKKLFDKWVQGKTGFPIVDAGMRQLNKTGYMHNRCRMIVANFLVKIMLIDWRWGEKYFATQLVDYDPANNNGGWQWSASTGTDSQPYFRYFNPFSQSAKYDNDCTYIKKWVPELANVDNKTIHDPDKLFNMTIPNYPKPIFTDDEVKKRIKKIMKMFSS